MATTTATGAPLAARRTTIAMKFAMAVSGAVFVLYVIAHMYGNLKAFAGATAYDDYAEHLRTIGEPILPYGGFLWVLRVVLVGSLVVHVYSAFYLWSRARTARPQRYAVKRAVASSLSAKWMRWGGVFLLLFVVWHLLQFTTHSININGQSGDVFGRLHAAFVIPWCTLLYLLAMVALFMHLRHGVWSACQTLGWTGSARARRHANTAAYVIAIVTSVGFSLVPLGIAFGIIS